MNVTRQHESRAPPTDTPTNMPHPPLPSPVTDPAVGEGFDTPLIMQLSYSKTTLHIRAMAMRYTHT